MSWRRATCCLALLFRVSSKGRGVDWDSCNRRFEAPEPGSTALALNGVRLPDTCFDSELAVDQHQIFIIGDWGGLPGDPETGPVTADHRKDGFHKREFVGGLDDVAQHVVRDRIRERAADFRPEYILNVGDNFYWGGVEATCGTTRQNMSNFSSQWEDIFENFYTGDGLDGVQWLGVLGNHDYGGYLYSNAWDQAIMYTWKEPEQGRAMRWVTPAQYWRSTVHYKTFSVDYFFLDSNTYDAFEPFEEMANNICSYAYNPLDNGVDCSGEGGPTGIDGCHDWFRELWDEQLEWLHLHLSNSTADWQIIVTHFPPTFDRELFGNLSLDYGIDLFVTGHLHRQEVHGAGVGDDFMGPTAWVVSGGGGGITSDYLPNLGGDSQYGFMHMTLSNDSIEVVNVQHTGVEGPRVVVSQRPCVLCSQDDVAHNLQVYQEGLLRRGTAGSPRFSSSTMTTVTTILGMTVTTTTTDGPLQANWKRVQTAVNQAEKSVKHQAENATGAAKAMANGVVQSISDGVVELKKSGRDVSNRTAQEIAAGETTIVSMASETAQWVGWEMAAGKSKVVDETAGRRELLRASGAVENVMSSPSGAAGVGAAAALVAALVLWLLRGSSSTACRPGVLHHDPDGGHELLLVDVAPHLLNEGQPPHAEEALSEDDRVWNPP